MTNKNLQNTINQLVDSLRNNEKRRVRRAITNTLSILGKESIEYLISYLIDDDWKVKEGVIIALHSYSECLLNNLPELLNLLEDEHVYVRQAASWLIGEIGSQDAIALIMKKYTETSDCHEQFYYALGLALIEGVGSFGDQELMNLSEAGELDEWQTVIYNKYLYNLQNRNREIVPLDYKINLIALNSINKILQGNSKIHISQIRNLNDLIGNHGTNKIEFKAVFRYDYKTKKVQKELEKRVLKTIVSFMNTEGGILVIGIDDKGNVIGLQSDYQTLGKNKQNRDGYQLKLNEIFENYRIKIQAINLMNIFFERIDGGEICIITVKKSSSPVFLKNDGNLYVRMGNSSRPLSAQEAIEYNSTHF